MEKKENKNDNDNGFIVTAVIVTIVIIGLWFVTYYALKDKPSTDRGTFGDMFGSINALFSGLALTGIILTILLQRKELKLQRKELIDTRQEFKTQNETLKIERFENTFFNLLNQHHQIVNAIDYRYYKNKTMAWGGGPIRMDEEKEAVVINRRDVFLYRYNIMVAELKKTPRQYEDIYLKSYEAVQTDLGHYFRNLYRMIKLVDTTDFFYDIKKVSAEEIFKTNTIVIQV